MLQCWWLQCPMNKNILFDSCNFLFITLAFLRCHFGILQIRSRCLLVCLCPSRLLLVVSVSCIGILSLLLLLGILLMMLLLLLSPLIPLSLLSRTLLCFGRCTLLLLPLLLSGLLLLPLLLLLLVMLLCSGSFLPPSLLCCCHSCCLLFCYATSLFLGYVGSSPLLFQYAPFFLSFTSSLCYSLALLLFDFTSLFFLALTFVLLCLFSFSGLAKRLFLSFLLLSQTSCLNSSTAFRVAIITCCRWCINISYHTF
mmetsp:Transcript_425/g.609  ORF Transcript_425/g.609 Transcript_425/m.609 type:complete len:254 (+) Transcript_425:2249-3010(+)